MSKTCEICGQAARSVIDNSSRVCAACSMFYRRNFKNWTTLKCSNNENCDLTRVKNNRRLCPKCRMLKSRMIGLRMAGKSLIIQRNGLPVDDLPEEEEQQQSSIPPNYIPQHKTSTAESIETCWQVNKNLELLTKAVKVFKNFAERQLFLSSIHQDRQLSMDEDVEPMQITLDQYPWLENRVLMLACEIINDILKDFNGVNHDDKVKAFKQVAFHACLVFKFYLTMQTFPNLGDNRLCLYPAYYIDSKDQRHFLRALDEEKFQTASKIIGPFFQRIFDCAERARRFRPTPVECAALFMLAIYDKLERLKILPDEAIKAYDQLCSELGQHILSETKMNAFVRLPRLMTCLYDAYMVNEIYEDSYSLIGVLFPDLRDLFCTQKPELSSLFVDAVVQNTTV
ncbi:hypothetical protein M3Y97_00614800 [Aphelenchoides bicaudatus]|nr:hypothetical protein M3Y97_00614800 [Aphelenchoides bicaudatus]